MKIFNATDMHGDLDSLITFYQYARDNNADLIVVSGDLADHSVPEEAAEERMRSLQMMHQLTIGELQRRGIKALTNYETYNAMPVVARQILELKTYPKPWKESAEEYLKSLKKYTKAMDSVYNSLDIIAAEDVLFIPGNHDRDLQLLGYESNPELFKKLKESDMHLKSKESNGFKVAGYGGACGNDFGPLMHALMVGEVTIPFRESFVDTEEDGFLERKVKSEAKDFLMQETPDIALVHMPPYGFLDTQNMKGPNCPTEVNTGSRGLREYAESGSANLMLCGHMHGQKGIVKIMPMEYSALEGPKEKEGNPAILINPGPLGRHVAKGHVNFAEIEMDDETREFKSATFYSTVDPNDPESISPVARAYMAGGKVKIIYTSPALPDHVTLKDCKGFDDVKNQKEGIMRRAAEEGRESRKKSIML